MGYLSNDKNLIAAYQSKDIYIHTAKLFDYVPETATEETHPKERDIFKVLYLANSYGQGPVAVAQALKTTLLEAKYLQKKYGNIFNLF